jgi:hypothetical protein
MSALITEGPVFDNLPTPLKETPTDDGTDISSAEPNVPGCDIKSVAKYFTTGQKSAVPLKRR